MNNRKTLQFVACIITMCFMAPVLSENERNLPSLNFYGSLRAHLAYFDDNAEIQDNSSRIGFKFRQQFDEHAALFARTEWSLNLVDNDVEFNVDQNPDSNLGEITTSESDTFGTRLGYLGLDLNQYGQITLGKQWSVYYDITKFTDRFFVFGAQATGTFNAGTDGGVTGTGRAEKALVYRFNFGKLKIGIQSQLRGDTDDSIDSYGISTVYHFKNNMDIGLTFNNANISSDALAAIVDIEEDATAASLGIRYWQGSEKPNYHSKLYLAAVYTNQKSNEVVSIGTTPVAYDANGVELIGHYKFDNQFMLMAGANFLDPKNLHPSISDDFRTYNYIATLAYWFTKQGLVYFENKINRDKDSTGTAQDNVYTIGLRYDFKV